MAKLPAPKTPGLVKGLGVTFRTMTRTMFPARGIKTLIVCGVTTEVCVNTSVREANDRGYECVVLSDCVGSYFPEFQKAALAMIKAQGGIFGWVSDSRRALAVAALYDMQHDPTLGDEMTYVSPSSGDRVGLSFIIPRTREDLERRRGMMLRWARRTCGMMGRSPDFMNVTFAAWAGAADYFARCRPEFADNLRRYYEYIRENDLTLTHSLMGRASVS